MLWLARLLRLRRPHLLRKVNLPRPPQVQSRALRLPRGLGFPRKRRAHLLEKQKGHYSRWNRALHRRGRIIRGISPLEAGAARAIPAPTVTVAQDATLELPGNPRHPRVPDSALPDRPGEPRRHDSALPLHQWEGSQSSQQLQPQPQSGRDDTGEQTDQGIAPMQHGASGPLELLGDLGQPRLPDSALPDRPGELRRNDSALPVHQWESSQPSQQPQPQPQLQPGREDLGEQTDQGIAPMQEGAPMPMPAGADVDISSLLEPLPPGWHTSGNFEWGLHPSLDVFEDDSEQPGDGSPELDYNPETLDSIGAWEKCIEPEPSLTTASEYQAQSMTSGTDPQQPVKDEVDFSGEGSPAPPDNTAACDNGVALPVLPPSSTAATETLTLADIAGASPDHPMSPHSEASEGDNTGGNPPSPTGPPPSLNAQQRARLHALLQQRDEWGQVPYNLDAYGTDQEKWQAYRNAMRESYRQHRKRERAQGTWAKDRYDYRIGQRRGDAPANNRTRSPLPRRRAPARDEGEAPLPRRRQQPRDDDRRW